MSAERLQALAAARLKAVEVRRARAAQKAETRELQRLEQELESQNLVKRRQELKAKLAQGTEDTPSLTPARSASPHREPPNRKKGPHPAPETPPVSSDEEPSPPRAKNLASYRARMQQMKEDLVFKSIFGC